MILANGFSTSQIGRCITPRRLALTILPTEKCNFRCTYCYETFKLGQMPEAVRTGVKALLSERTASGLDSINLSWFGGEPLLAPKVIFDIARHAKYLATTNSIALSGGFTTNGYLLTSSLVQELAELNHDFYQISLDGWDDAHNETRRRADGAGTFARIWENLLAIRTLECHFEILLRLHVRPDNIDSLAILCTNIASAFAGDRRFRVNFQDIRLMGGPGAKNVTPMSDAAFRDAVTNLTRRLKPPSNSFSSISITEKIQIAESAGGQRASDAAMPEPYICYAAKPNHYLIRADGRVGKCTVFLDDDRNIIGRLTPDGRINLNEPKTRLWHIGFETLDPQILGCPVHAITKTPSETTRRAERELPIHVVVN